MYRFPIRILLGEKDGKIQFEFHYLPFSMNRLSLDGKIGLFFFQTIMNYNEDERGKEIEELIFHRDSLFFSFFFFLKLREKNFAESIYRKFIGGNSIVPSSIESSTDMRIYEPINSRFRSFRARTNFSYKNYR